MPLQKLAAWVAVHVLNLTGVPATDWGTKIVMYKGPNVLPRVLNVEEACAGRHAFADDIPDHQRRDRLSLLAPNCGKS